MLNILASLIISLTPITLIGTVNNVHDGDTITIPYTVYDQFSGKKYEKDIKIRLNEIDAPELKQPLGDSCRNMLAKMVLNKTVEVDLTGDETYNRYVGSVYVDGVNVSHEMVRNGCAFVYRNYKHSDIIESIENQARSKKLGIWSIKMDKPADYRKRNKH